MTIKFTYLKREWINGYRKCQFPKKGNTKLHLFILILLWLLFASKIRIDGMTTINLTILILYIICNLILVYGRFIMPHVIYKPAYIFIPKRAFESEEQREQFRRLLESKLKLYKKEKETMLPLK